MLHLHTLFAWLVLMVMIPSVLFAFAGFYTKRPFTKLQNTFRLLAVIITGVQLVLGLVIYFTSKVDYLGKFSQMGEVMKNPLERFNTIEHPLTMIIGIIIIHIGSAKIKRAQEQEKNKKALIFFGIALLIIFSRFPWDRLFF
jgi:predicted membrane channel-forming protein YqfA (hemolysin III family)